MADVIKGVGKGVEIAKDLIPLLKDLIGYFRIRYGVAYESLRLIIDDITKAHESMFYWANRFEHMSREPTKKKQDFDTFSFESWLKAADFPYRHTRTTNMNRTRHTFIIQHDMGRKYSVFAAEGFKTYFEPMKTQGIEYSITDNIISITVEGA